MTSPQIRGAVDEPSIDLIKPSALLNVFSETPAAKVS